MSNILEIRSLRKTYPGVVALDDFSCDFREGEVHALIGENGAGKSTLIKCIAGAISPDSGTIAVNGIGYLGLDANLAKQMGIEVIYQEFNLVPPLTAAENVYLNEKTDKGFIVNGKKREQMAAEIFRSMGIDLNPAQQVWGMSPANMQIVEIAKAVSRNVKILIMDEPTAPLTLNEVDMLFRIVKDLKAKGVTIIYISHRLEELFEIADRVTVMRDGKFVVTKDISEVNRQELISLMTGRQLTSAFPERNSQIGEEVLRAENLCGWGVEGVNFTLRKGEVLGFAGLVGAGRTEIMSVLYGAFPKTCGQTYVKGKEVDIKSPKVAVEHGIGLIPEDRKNQGVFLFHSIRWNITIGIVKQLSKLGIVNANREKAVVSEYATRFEIKAPSYEQPVLFLSGGNQQKVVLAKTMATHGDIIIFDEPTRGIDVGAKWEIYKLINELVETGKSVIIISSEMPELLGMCDNIVVLYEHEQTGVVPKAKVSQGYILHLASGGSADNYE
jgi:ribose transport system ATP-binding protein